jgi:hypothetical protein
MNLCLCCLGPQHTPRPSPLQVSYSPADLASLPVPLHARAASAQQLSIYQHSGAVFCRALLTLPCLEYMFCPPCLVNLTRQASPANTGCQQSGLQTGVSGCDTIDYRLSSQHHATAFCCRCRRSHGCMAGRGCASAAATTTPPSAKDAPAEELTGLAAAIAAAAAGGPPKPLMLKGGTQ